MNSKSILTTVVVAAVAVAGGLTASHYWMRSAPPEVAPDTGGNAGNNAANNAAAAAPTPAAPAANAADTLFAATYPRVDGEPGTLAAFKGHKLVVNFWASWCGPCVREMPELVTLSHEYAKKGVRFVGIGVDSDKNVKAFLQKVKVDYPIFISGYAGADLARNFGNTAGALPFTVVIDEDGKIRSTKLGEIHPDELKHTLDSM